MRHARAVPGVVILALALAGVAAAPALAEPPANDMRAAAAGLSPPEGVSGTTAGSTLQAEETPTVNGAAAPTRCCATHGRSPG